MKRASWLIALKQRNYLSIWSRPGLTKDKITENNTRQLWLVAFWKKRESLLFFGTFPCFIPAKDCSPRLTSCWAATWRTSGSRRRSSKLLALKGEASQGNSTNNSLSRFSLLSFFFNCFLHTTTSGLGRGWLWDFQENDDPEEHWSANGSTGAVTTKVQINDKFQMKKSKSKIHDKFQMKKSKSKIHAKF